MNSTFRCCLVLIAMSVGGFAHGAMGAVQEGQGGWLFLASELRHLSAGPFWGEHAALVGRATNPDTRDPFPAILDFHQALQELNVQLLLVPVPPKATVYAEKLPASEVPKPTNEYLSQFYDVLRAAGVPVLDLAAALSARDPLARGPSYCLTDSHWSGIGCVDAAKAIAPSIREFVDKGQASFGVEWREISIDGDLARMQGEAGAQESVAVRAVDGSTIDPTSQVLILGDSHTLVFHAGGDMHYSGAGLADQLAYELGMPVDVIGVRGSGATPARINLFRRVRQNAAFWEQKRVVVWVFAAREFTESDGWRVVPVRMP